MRRFFELLKRAFQAWKQDKAPQIGASLAYYAIFSLAPLLIALVGAVGLIFQHSSARQQLLNEVQQNLGSNGSQLVGQLLTGLNHPTDNLLALIIGIITTLAGALGIFSQLQEDLTTVLGDQAAGSGLRGTAKRYTRCLLMLAIVVIAIPLSAGLTALFAYLGNYILWKILALILSVALQAAVISALFTVLPGCRLPRQPLWRSAILTAILFTIGRHALSLYILHSGFASAYGAAGSVLVLLFWIYYSAQILLFGAEFLKVSQQPDSAKKPASARRPWLFLGLLGTALFLRRKRR